MGGREISIQENTCACGPGIDNWVMDIESEVKENENLKKKEMGAWKKSSIYKLPKGFESDQKRGEAYSPQVVSLGPYHHGKRQVLAMEEHKRRALRQLLVRTKKSVRDYQEALKGRVVLEQLMDSYKDLDEACRKDEEGFLKLMILDGCFMLEVMRVVTKNVFGEYAANDPIFSYHGMLSNLPRIKRDMLMLENQIPLLVLHKLTAVEKGLIHEQDKEKLWELHREVNNMVLDFFQQEKMETPPSLKTRFMRRMHRSFVRLSSKQTSAADTGASTTTGTSTSTSTSTTTGTSTNTSTTTPPVTTTPLPQTIRNTKKQSNSAPVTETNNAYPPAAATTSSDDHEVWGLHVLDVVRKSMIKEIKGRRRRSGGVQTGSYDVIWPATQLEEAGIQFRKSDSTSLKDITFQTGFLHATLSLPQLLVDDATESKFLNLMAFEHLHTGSGKEVSSYVCFMDNIIDSDKDVSLLSKNNIIKNFVGTDQAVADLFNGISHDVSIDPASDLGRVHRDVTAHCNDPFNKNCANLKHGYFNTPWSAIAFVAASVALVISIIQFVYALLSYYLHQQ